MSLRTRIFLAFSLAGAAGLYLLADRVRSEVRFHYLKSMEESLVDTANLLSAFLTERAAGGRPDASEFRRALEEVGRRELSARIYDLVKTRVDLRVYVTDGKGLVLFDSDGGRDEGKETGTARICPNVSRKQVASPGIPSCNRITASASSSHDLQAVLPRLHELL